MTDPNGWVQQPPQTMVKIVGTSRENLNGMLALVLQFDTSKNRYIVHTVTNQGTMSFKKENLVKASWMEQLTGQYQLVRNDPQMRRQIDGIVRQVETATGAKWQVLAGGLGVLVLVMIYFFGFSKTLFALSLLLLLAISMGPDRAAGLSWTHILTTSLPAKVEEGVAQIPVVGPRLSRNRFLTYGIMGLMAFLSVRTLLLPSRPSGATSSSASSSSSPFSAVTSLWSGSSISKAPVTGGSSRMPVALTAENQRELYKLGFDDATAEREFGYSLPPLPVQKLETATAEETTTTEDYSEWVEPEASSSGSSSMWKHVGTVLSAAFLFRTLEPMARTPEGRYDVQLLLANVQTMDAMKMGLLGFSLYRLVQNLM